MTGSAVGLELAWYLTSVISHRYFEVPTQVGEHMLAILTFKR